MLGFLWHLGVFAFPPRNDQGHNHNNISKRQEGMCKVDQIRKSQNWLKRIRSLILTLLTFAAMQVLTAQNMQTAPGAQIFNLTEPGFYSEPAVTIDPENPQHIIVVFQNEAHAAYSRDEGKHWTVASGVQSKQYRVSGDVSAAFDTKGHAIICYMAFDKLGTFNYWGHNSSRNGLYVRRSLDGGKTWEPQDHTIVAQTSSPDVPWEDKPYIVSDTTKGPYSGNLYVGWTRWSLTNSKILLTRSSDDGLTWSTPIEIDDHPGLPRDDNGALEGFDGAVDNHGKLYAVWAGDNHIQFAVSRNGGKSFSRPRNIIDTAPIMFQVESVERSNGFPQIAVDSRGRKDRLYVTWSDYRNGDVDVFCSTSTDGGRTWTTANRVNNDPIHNGADQFFQWLALDPSSGAVNVMFYDRRTDPTNRSQTIVLARSTDGGKSFVNYAWTQKPFDAFGDFLGDYTGLAAMNGRVYGAWTIRPSQTLGNILQVGIADFPESGSKH